MEPAFIYFKEAFLNNENKFTLDFSDEEIAAVLIKDLSGRPMDVQRLHKVVHQISHI